MPEKSPDDPLPDSAPPRSSSRPAPNDPPPFGAFLPVDDDAVGMGKADPAKPVASGEAEGPSKLEPGALPLDTEQSAPAPVEESPPPSLLDALFGLLGRYEKLGAWTWAHLLALLKGARLRKAVMRIWRSKRIRKAGRAIWRSTWKAIEGLWMVILVASRGIWRAATKGLRGIAMSSRVWIVIAVSGLLITLGVAEVGLAELTNRESLVVELIVPLSAIFDVEPTANPLDAPLLHTRLRAPALEKDKIRVTLGGELIEANWTIDPYLMIAVEARATIDPNEIPWSSVSGRSVELQVSYDGEIAGSYDLVLPRSVNVDVVFPDGTSDGIVRSDRALDDSLLEGEIARYGTSVDRLIFAVPPRSVILEYECIYHGNPHLTRSPDPFARFGVNVDGVTQEQPWNGPGRISVPEERLRGDRSLSPIEIDLVVPRSDRPAPAVTLVPTLYPLRWDIDGNPYWLNDHTQGAWRLGTETGSLQATPRWKGKATVAKDRTEVIEFPGCAMDLIEGRYYFEVSISGLETGSMGIVCGNGLLEFNYPREPGGDQLSTKIGITALQALGLGPQERGNDKLAQEAISRAWLGNDVTFDGREVVYARSKALRRLPQGDHTLQLIIDVYRGGPTLPVELQWCASVDQDVVGRGGIEFPALAVNQIAPELRRRHTDTVIVSLFRCGVLPLAW